MSESIRNKIRQQIKPMPKARLFPTGWNGELTFEQIAELNLHRPFLNDVFLSTIGKAIVESEDDKSKQDRRRWSV